MARKGPAARVTFRITKDGEVRLRRIGGLTGKKEREKMAKKPRQRWRTSPDGTLYIPMKDRTLASQKRATAIQKAACSAGAWAAMARPGYSVSPRKSCGPKTTLGDSRSHRMLALWRHGEMVEFAREARKYKRKAKKKAKKRRRNPGKPGTVDFVWQPNEGSGSAPVEFGVIEPRSETVLKTGTAKNPEAAHAAAQKVGRDFVSNPGKFVTEIEKAIEEHEWEHHRPGLPYGGRDVEVRSGREWTQVPRKARRKRSR
jgi:hypothetical protein